MAVVNVKEIYKEYHLAKKHFNKAIELAKKNLIVGEINFSIAEKKTRTKKAKVTPDPEGKEGE